MTTIDLHKTDVRPAFRQHTWYAAPPQNNTPKVGEVHEVTFFANQQGVDPVGKIGRIRVFGKGVPLGTHMVKITHVSTNCLFAQLDDTHVSSLVVGQTYTWLVRADGNRRFAEVAGQRIYVPRSAKPDEINKFVFDGEHPDDNHCIELRAKFLNPPIVDKKVEREAKQLHVSPENMPLWTAPVARPWPTIKSTKSNDALVQHCAELVRQKQDRRANKWWFYKLSQTGVDPRKVQYKNKMSQLLGPRQLTTAQVREMERLEAIRSIETEDPKPRHQTGDGLGFARMMMARQHAASQIRNLNLVIEKADPNSRRKFWAKDA